MDDAAKISVALEAATGTLKSDIDQAQAIVAQGTERMAQTVAQNNPLKSLQKGLAATGIIFGVHMLSQSLVGLTQAMRDVRSGGDPFEAYARAVPMFGQLTGSAEDFWRELTNVNDEIERAKNLQSLHVGGQDSALAFGNKLDELNQQLDLENAIGEQNKVAARFALDTGNNERKANEERRKINLEFDKRKAEIQIPQLSANQTKWSEEMRMKKEQALRDIAEIERERVQSIKRIDQIEAKQNEIAIAKQMREQNDASLKARKDSIEKRISDTRELLNGIGNPSDFMSTVSTAYGAFRTGQADAATAAMNRQATIQERIETLLRESKSIQQQIAQNGGGPN